MKVLSLFDGAWKPVANYEGFYEVNRSGEIRRIGKEKPIKQKQESNGYIRVHLSKQGISESVLLHRIVAAAWCDNPSGYTTVNHIDENKANNNAINLEWCNMAYQNTYGNGAIARNKAKEKPVSQWDRNGNFIKCWGSIKSAAEALNLSQTSIICVCDGKRRYKSTGGWVFKRENEVGHGN